MEAKGIIQLQSLEPYRYLFPKAKVVDSTVKMGADVSDTVDFIPKVIRNTQWQVKEFVDKELKGLPVHATCEKLWHFVKYHVQYKKDKRGLEQVRSPRRLIHDGVGDCDCFTTFIGACLAALKIPVVNRITKYKQDYFQHIYPIVPLGNGKYITMDCVVNRFNYEEPYTEKKDYNMDLQYLDGVEGTEKMNQSVDAQDLFGWEDDMGELGKLFKRKAATSAIPGASQDTKPKKGFQKIKAVAKKALNVTNKINPATVVLRAGILASMKLNVMKVAENLKWAYLTEAEAKKRGMDMSKFAKLKNVLTKIEGIFYTAGGKPENLKSAILTGRGNRNKEVSGFGLVSASEIDLSGFGETTPMPQLLGDVYYDEFVNGLEGTEGLGVVATSASVAAASTVMGSIAVLLKSIGNLFPKKKGAEEAGAESSDSTATDSSGEPTDTTANESSGEGTNENLPATGSSKLAKKAKEESGETESTGDESKDGTDDSKKGLKGFWENNKKWIKPVGIGLAVAGALYAGYKMMKSGSGSEKKTNKGQAALNGFSRRKHKKRKEGRRKGKHGKKSNIALL